MNIRLKRVVQLWVAAIALSTALPALANPARTSGSLPHTQIKTSDPNPLLPDLIVESWGIGGIIDPIGNVGPVLFVTVKNVGAMPAGASRTLVNLGNTFWSNFPTPPLAAGQSWTRMIEWTFMNWAWEGVIDINVDGQHDVT